MCRNFLHNKCKPNSFKMSRSGGNGYYDLLRNVK